jgi:hypothetical protein
MSKSAQDKVPFRVFSCTDHTVEVVRLLETYAGRWAIEVFFREGEQLLCLADSSARTDGVDIFDLLCNSGYLKKPAAPAPPPPDARQRLAA